MLPLFHYKLKHKFTPHLAPKIKSYIKVRDPQSILDIGCGAGESTHMYGRKEAIVNLAKNNWDVYGIEPSEEARNSLKMKGIENIYSDLFNSPFEDNSFDIIRLNWSLEHIHYPTLYLKKCKELLKYNGKMIVSIPNYKGITYKIFPECVEVPLHLYYFCVDTFKKYARKLDLTIVDYYTFSYAPLFITALEFMEFDSLAKKFRGSAKMTIELNTFLKTMGHLGLGDDMVFCLTKERCNGAK